MLRKNMQSYQSALSTECLYNVVTMSFIYNGIKTHNNRTHTISYINKTRLYVDQHISELLGHLYTDRLMYIKPMSCMYYSFNGICGDVYDRVDYETHATDKTMRYLQTRGYNI